MNLTAQLLEQSIRTVATSLSLMQNEAPDIIKAYFSTDASTLVGALSSGTDGATVSSRLSKTDFINGINFATQLDAFFQNQAVAQGDYLQTVQVIINANSAPVNPLSPAVEAIGLRLVALSQNAIELFKQTKNILKLYSASELSLAVDAIGNTTVIFGGDSTKSKFINGITLVEQFKKILNAEVVLTGDYATSVLQWNS
jgi:hypothetical protein